MTQRGSKRPAFLYLAINRRGQENLNDTGSFGSPAASQRAQRPSEDTAAPSGVSINGYRDVHIRDSEIAGRDIQKTTNNTTINKNRKIQLGLGAAAVAVVSVGAFGIHLATNSSSARGIVYTAGAQGAAGTVQQMQQAEEAGNASSWCFLASSADSGTCQGLMSNGYTSTRSATIRAQVPDITVDQPSGSGDSYTINLIYKGHSYPVALEWTGQRWQLNSVDYLAALNNGGLFASVIETATGTGALFGVPF